MGLGGDLYLDAFDFRIVIRMKVISVLNLSVVGCLRERNLNKVQHELPRDLVVSVV